MKSPNELTGVINERRRTFESPQGWTGQVEFGRTALSGEYGQVFATHAKVTLTNGVRYWTRYTSPKQVLLKKYV